MVTEDDNSDILNLEFVAKCEGRYSVSVNMYGVGVKGSPMVVDILCSEMRLYRNSKRWLYKLYKQKIIMILHMLVLSMADMGGIG